MSLHLDSIANGTMFACAVTTAVAGLFVPDILLSSAMAAPVPWQVKVEPERRKIGSQSVLSDVRLVRECGVAECK
jgi:hypothetical protein